MALGISSFATTQGGGQTETSGSVASAGSSSTMTASLFGGDSCSTGGVETSGQVASLFGGGPDAGGIGAGGDTIFGAGFGGGDCGGGGGGGGGCSLA